MSSTEEANRNRDGSAPGHCAVLGDEAAGGDVGRGVGVALRPLRPMLPAQGRGRGYRQDLPHGARLPPARRALVPLPRLCRPACERSGLRGDHTETRARSAGCRRAAPTAASRRGAASNGGIRWCRVMPIRCTTPASPCAVGCAARRACAPAPSRATSSARPGERIATVSRTACGLGGAPMRRSGLAEIPASAIVAHR